MFADVELTFDESLKEGGITKSITVSRKQICKSCNGNRASSKSKSHPCKSCNAKGIKIDALFNNKVKCKVCHGHGIVIEEQCTTCFGEGLVE